MKVLHYNWADPYEAEGRGGGVSVYLRNLLEALAEQDGIEASMVSSGLAHDPLRPGPRWEALRGPGARPRHYRIVNSGVLAPAHDSFGDPAQLSHPATTRAFHDLLAATGPYDVVHFHNLEGLPAEVLDLGTRFPGTRVLLTLHNYYPFCPQVNLWRQERRNCTDFEAGRACIDCLPHQADPRLLRAAHGLAYRLQRAGIRPGSRAFDLVFAALRAGRRGLRRAALLARAARALPRPGPALPAPGPAPGASQPAPGGGARAEAFARRRAEMVTRINAGCDRVLCVSDRVRQIAARHGIDAALLETGRIGTRQAATFAATRPRPALPRPDGTLRLAYLGYMRRDKGFPFLLAALDGLPPEIAGRLHLLVAARRGEPWMMQRLAGLAPRLAGLEHRDGYDHAGLDALLADVDLGLVPVQWEDNLPQVAIEMHARHIPLLTSDLGGAQELGRAPGMVFRADSPEAFRDRIAALLAGGFDPAAYWRGARAPLSMAQHLAALQAAYSRAPARAGRPAAAAAPAPASPAPAP